MNIEQIADVATVVALAVPLTAWYWERRNRKRIEEENERRIWSDISKIRGIMIDLEKDQGASDSSGRMTAAGKLMIMLRELLREASIAEKNYSIATIQKWRAVGKLGSQWQEQLALMLLRTNEIEPGEFEALRPTFSSTEELPDGHPMQAPQGRGAPNVSSVKDVQAPGASSPSVTGKTLRAPTEQPADGTGTP